jgi:hypothetical protein
VRSKSTAQNLPYETNNNCDNSNNHHHNHHQHHQHHTNNNNSNNNLEVSSNMTSSNNIETKPTIISKLSQIGPGIYLFFWKFFLVLSCMIESLI